MAGVARLETGVSGRSGNVRSDTKDSKNVNKIGDTTSARNCTGRK